MSFVAVIAKEKAMRTTFNKLMTWGMTLAVVGGLAATAIAGGPPYDAGFKARGMKEANNGRRVTQTYVAPQAGYRNFSYAPQAPTNVGPATRGNVVATQPQAVAKAPQATADVRRFSYQPGTTVPAPVYRNWNYGTGAGRGRTGYGGDYQSKALLYK
jgi:hypothetical protein